jgi:hypothetical protein
MRHALAFLTAALLFTGCHKNTGENPTPPADDASYRDAGGTTGATGTTGNSLAAPSGGGTQAPGATKAQAGTQTPGGDKAAVEACVDRWLQEHKLDPYGNAEGTMYAGGTPLFNEATGETHDRLEYVFSRQPEAQKACVAKGTK